MELLALASGMIIFVVILCYIPLIFYALTLQNTFKAISPENRKMDSAQVWLLLIPFFGLVWQFIIVNKISESLEAEYRMRGKEMGPKPTYQLGLAMSIVMCCTLIPFLAWITSLGSLVLWIMYWVKIAEHKNTVTSLRYNDRGSQIF